MTEVISADIRIPSSFNPSTHSLNVLKGYFFVHLFTLSFYYSNLHSVKLVAQKANLTWKKSISVKLFAPSLMERINIITVYQVPVFLLKNTERSDNIFLYPAKPDTKKRSDYICIRLSRILIKWSNNIYKNGKRKSS